MWPQHITHITTIHQLSQKISLVLGALGIPFQTSAVVSEYVDLPATLVVLLHYRDILTEVFPLFLSHITTVF